jgi:hypothetical protein
MIQFLQHEMIDKVRWDQSIACAVNGNLNACSWFLDIVSPGWCALADGNYENIFPLPVSFKAGIGYIMQPYFTQQLGLFSQTQPTENMVSEFLNTIPSRYRYIDINLNTSSFPGIGKNIQSNINLELDLEPGYTELAAAYHPNLQRNLKKARQNKFSLVKNVNPNELISLFRTHKGQQLKHLKDPQYKLIQRLAEQSLQNGTGQVWGVTDTADRLLAAALWITSHSKAVFQFSAVTDAGRKQHAMPWLIDTFIREHAGNPLTLDFEGSNNESLARFYGSFGARKIIYHRYKKNMLPAFLRIALNTWRLVREKLKK